MYTLTDYSRMLHPARIAAFHSEMQKCINNHSIVLDLGAGFGHFAIYAAKLGAKRVYAIETNPALKLCEKLARKNCVDDRLTILNSDSRLVRLPERVDVLVADVRGALPIFQDSIDVIDHACQSHLVDGGVLMPLGDDIYVSPVSFEHYHDQCIPFDHHLNGLDYSAIQNVVYSSPIRVSGHQVKMLSAASLWRKIRYSSHGVRDSSYTLRFIADSSGQLSGLLAWSRLIFPSGHVLDNSPMLPELPYGQLFFPLRERGIRVQSGESIECQIESITVKGRLHWRWQVSLNQSGQSFENNTLLTQIFS